MLKNRPHPALGLAINAGYEVSDVARLLGRNRANTSAMLHRLARTSRRFRSEVSELLDRPEEELFIDEPRVTVEIAQ